MTGDGIALGAAPHPIAPWWQRLWFRLRHPRNRLNEYALETVMIKASQLGTIRLKNETALQFKGPATAHCFGVPYVTLSIRGVAKEGEYLECANDMHEANRLFFAELDEYTKDAWQIAWRSYPEVRELAPGAWNVRCRLAVWK